MNKLQGTFDVHIPGSDNRRKSAPSPIRVVYNDEANTPVQIPDLYINVQDIQIWIPSVGILLQNVEAEMPDRVHQLPPIPVDIPGVNNQHANVEVQLPAMNIQRGLTPDRIQYFQQFQAGISLVANQCGVCLDDIEVGRRMMKS